VKKARLKGRLPPALARCPGCGEYIFQSAKKCPHCKGSLKRLSAKEAKAVAKAEAALATLQKLFGG
jgi:uncharacterized protein with PIN domain